MNVSISINWTCLFTVLGVYGGQFFFLLQISMEHLVDKQWGSNQMLRSLAPVLFTKVSKGCKDQESIQSNTTPDPGYQCESAKLTGDTTNESQ